MDKEWYALPRFEKKWSEGEKALLYQCSELVTLDKVVEAIHLEWILTNRCIRDSSSLYVVAQQ